VSATPAEEGDAQASAKKKKKKKGEDERDAQGRRTLLTDCEVRGPGEGWAGEPRVGEKLTAFAKRAKKVPIGCRFQWYRVDPQTGREAVIDGQDRASYVVTALDCGYVLKVTSSPTIKETGEDGAPVFACTRVPVAGAGSGAFGDDGEEAEAGVAAAEPSDADPVLTDWKIEMHPHQEYTDPIRIHYEYSGGREGNSIIQWFREVDGMEGCGQDDHHFEAIALDNPLEYVPSVEDVNKRIKIQITPVRIDGVEGLTYQHILDSLKCPQRTMVRMSRCFVGFARMSRCFVGFARMSCSRSISSCCSSLSVCPVALYAELGPVPTKQVGGARSKSDDKARARVPWCVCRMTSVAASVRCNPRAATSSSARWTRPRYTSPRCPSVCQSPTAP